jgi:polyphenol oxidase
VTVFAPDWPLPRGVGAAASTRQGGASAAPWNSLNLGGACGDDAQAVHVNRQAFAQAIGARPVWLQQLHGVQVLRLTAHAQASLPPADAAWTTEPGLACTVLVADCLPVLLCTRDGHAVAAVHAGWRGLAAGVLEATLDSMRRGAGVQAADVLAWLGPCIGRRQFEVGADVLLAFGAAQDPVVAALFERRPRPDGASRWLADLAGLARLRLQRAGVRAICGDGRCTVEEPSDFFSFRRDGVTGRQAAAIWRRA